MMFPARALVICYIIAVHADGDQSKDEASVKNITNNNNSKLPNIHLVVRTYAEAEVVQDDAQKQDVELGDRSSDLPIDITDREEVTNEKAREVDSSLGANLERAKFNEPENSESSYKAAINEASLLTQSFERISNMVTVAWDYIALAEDQTQRPESRNDLSVSEAEDLKDIHESPKTEPLDNEKGANDVYLEEDNLKSTEDISQVFQEENSIDQHDHTFLNDRKGLHKVNSGIIKGDDIKIDSLVHKTKRKSKRNLRNAKVQDSKSKRLSLYHPRKNINNSKVRKIPSQKKRSSGKKISSAYSQSDSSGNDTHKNRQGGSNEIIMVKNNEENTLLQADQPSYLSYIFGGSDTGPEDTEIDDDTASVSPVSGYDGDVPYAAWSRVNAGQSYQTDLRYNSQRAVAEADLSTSDISRLIDHYDRCDTCMVNIQDTNQRCNIYTDQADEFDKWAKYYTDLLRYGCSSPDVQRRERCCHSGQVITQTTLHEINKLVKSISNVLSTQCQKCPVDCTWSEWQSWNHCPLTCVRSSTRNRTRTRTSQRYGGRYCSGSDLDLGNCIPEQGTWLSWSSWSACSSTCGGSRHRTRKCTQPSTYSCFVPCDDSRHSAFDVEQCGNPGCCHARQWSQWGAWTECDTGEAGSRTQRQRRWRRCEANPDYIDQPMCPQPCPGPEFDPTVKECCIPASWGEWSSWSDCLGDGAAVDLETGRPCGKGCSNRTRVCNPGTCPNTNCYGDHIERIFCSLEPCCVPPVWSQWCPWSECSVTSGTGIQRRTRVCQTDPDKWRSATCKAGGCYGQPDTSEVKDCKMEDCVKPSWGSWGHWSECDYNRANPRRTQTRHCIKNMDPECRHLECSGSSEQEGPCPCPEPSWGNWGQWSDCDFNRANPRRTMTRRCHKSSLPACQHFDCVGDSQREERCVCQPPYWDSWSQWGPCDQTSNPPVRLRHRQCRQANNPQYCPQETCVGDSVDRERCCRRQEWSPWGEWSQCNTRSNPPVRTRVRQCQRPDPGCPDEACIGLDREMIGCPQPLPPCVPPYWESWSQWGACDQSSNPPVRQRHRLCRQANNPQYCRQETCFGDTVERELCECQDDCRGRADGEYPSCRRGCRHFVTCCQGAPITNECSGAQQYDSTCQKCTKIPSPTCPDGQYDINRNRRAILYKKPEECRN